MVELGQMGGSKWKDDCAKRKEIEGRKAKKRGV